VPQHVLRVFQGSTLLHVRPQRPAHHLEGDETVRNIRRPGNRTDAPPKEVLSPARNRLPFPFSRPERGKHQGVQRGVVGDFRQASMTGRTEFN
jgi:hypothetical protein